MKAVEKPVGKQEGKYRVHRGGSWAYILVHCRSAYRDGGRLSGRRIDLGFRIAMEEQK